MAKKKRNRKSIKNNGYKLEELGIQKDDITKEELIDIYAEAYYKALKRIENESRSENEPEHKVKDYKKYEWVQYFLNVLFFPWRIRKKFKLKDNIYDNMLTLIISLYFVNSFATSFFILFYANFCNSSSNNSADVLKSNIPLG